MIKIKKKGERSQLFIQTPHYIITYIHYIERGDFGGVA